MRRESSAPPLPLSPAVLLLLPKQPRGNQRQQADAHFLVGFAAVHVAAPALVLMLPR